MIKHTLTFHPIYVAPYYGGLVNANFTKKDMVDQPKHFLKEVHALGDQLSEQEIVQLLHESWRPSKVGAWVIGLRQLKTLVPHLTKKLYQSTSHVEHLIFALALINTNESIAAIQAFVTNTLKEILELISSKKQYRALDKLESSSLHWGLTMLRYLDELNNPSILNMGTVKDDYIKLETSLFKSNQEVYAKRYLYNPETLSTIKKAMAIIEQTDLINPSHK